MNSAGMAETSCTLVVQEKARLVVVDDSQLNQKQRVNNQWKVEVKFTGFPKPQISWSKDGNKIESTKKCSLYVDEESTTIAIYALARVDTGIYQVSATNSAGTTVLDLNLRVIGVYLSQDTENTKTIKTTINFAFQSLEYLGRFA